MTPGEWLISPEGRVWRRRLDPLAWMVLEEVVLSARAHSDDPISAMSCRAVADAVGLDRDAVARALRRLCHLGLLARVEQARVGGRFAPGGYRVLVPYRRKPEAVGGRLAASDAARRAGPGEQLILIPIGDPVTSRADRTDAHASNDEPDRRNQRDLERERATARPSQPAHEFASAMRPGVVTVLVTDGKPSLC